MSNYAKISIGREGRTELHDSLGLTGAEISINELAAGKKEPYAHYHKQNEEIYAILSGRGKAVVDGEEIQLEKGDGLRISPAGKLPPGCQISVAAAKWDEKKAPFPGKAAAGGRGKGSGPGAF